MTVRLIGRAAELITNAPVAETFQQFKNLLEDIIPERIDFTSAFVKIQRLKQQCYEPPLDYICRFEEAYKNLENHYKEM